MLQGLDKALAGAIDFIADDVQATVKSVREQGMSATLKDAVGDAAGMVVGGAGSVFSSMGGGKKQPAQISTHSGLSGGYADILAGPGQRSFQSGSNGGNGGALYQYTPTPSAGKNAGGNGNGAASKFSAGNFAPGIGIQRTGGGAAPDGIQVFAKAQAPPNGGATQHYRSPPPYMPNAAPAPYVPSASASAAALTPTAAKQPPMPQEQSNVLFDQIKACSRANQACFDCNSVNTDWTSVSLGIFLCIECCGHHRNLGTHLSRVRSCKMDSWTPQQLEVFEHGGNERLGAFFEANGVQASMRYQRYSTPAAAWYRECWIKNRTLNKPVPPPTDGVKAGPCVDPGAAAAKPAADPVVDLLDFDGEKPTPKPKAAVPAPSAAHADLLGFGSEVQTSSGHGDDLLGMSGCPSQSQNKGGEDDLLGLTAISAAARPPSSTLLESHSVGATLAPATVTAPQAVVQDAAQTSYTPTASPAANSMAAGAKMTEMAKEKSDDPFAMALDKWGM
mmetsp:Transcript_18718/g.40874  ORF Transcript_18718/g.40874 Transcript_18718/m.40874 type:complete len:504 (+) Transcript_18718:78-1589(+)